MTNHPPQLQPQRPQPPFRIGDRVVSKYFGFEANVTELRERTAPDFWDVVVRKDSGERYLGVYTAYEIVKPVDWSTNETQVVVP